MTPRPPPGSLKPPATPRHSRSLRLDFSAQRSPALNPSVTRTFPRYGDDSDHPMQRCFLHRATGHSTVVTVRITVLGCSGSVVGPDSPASGYLLRAPDTPPLVIDFGGGVLGALQRHADPGSVHVLLSHLHADHCLDMPGLFVWRRYHPSPPKGKALLYGPSDTWSRLGAASSPYGGEIDDCSDIFNVHHWAYGEAGNFGSLTVLRRVVSHPTESYGLRITDDTGASFGCSADTVICDQLVELARDADVFLCEAS